MQAAGDLTKFLKERADELALKVPSEAFGEICIDPLGSYIIQSTGCVYGLIIELSDEDLQAASTEIFISGKTPIFSSWYPLYWGKDSNPGSRIRAHVQNHKGTGNAKLENYAFLQGRKIIYSMIWVENYAQFEAALHSKFPPLLGCVRPGKAASIVNIAY